MDSSNFYDKRRYDEKLHYIVRNKGYYDNSGVWNSISQSSDGKIFRNRVETLVIRDKKVLIKFHKDGTYKIPGGSVDINVPDIDQAVNECKEEARIIVKNIYYTGFTYKKLKPADKVVKNDKFINWDGSINKVFVANYDSMSQDYIEPVDRDNDMLSGEWYNIEEVISKLIPEHREAIIQYLKFHKEPEQVYAEAFYYINSIKNLFQIYDQYKHPDFNIEFVMKLLKAIDEEHKNIVKSSHFKKAFKRRDVIYEYNMVSLKFKSFNIIVRLSSLDTAGPAETYSVKPEGSNELEYRVVLHESFFTLTDDMRAFIILHEIGHDMLQHTRLYNVRLVDVVFNGWWRNIVSSIFNHVTFREYMADFYAVCNGASITGLLKLNKIDGKYSLKKYPDVQHEIILRYNKILTSYDLFKKLFGEAGNKDITSNLPKLTPEGAIFNQIYCNKKLDYLTESDKFNLYHIISKTMKGTCELDDGNLIKESVTTILPEINKLKFKHGDKYRYIERICESYVNSYLDNLSDDEYAISSLRKYPLYSKESVLDVIDNFNNISTDYRFEVVNKILPYIESYNIDIKNIPLYNNIHNYM